MTFSKFSWLKRSVKEHLTYKQCEHKDCKQEGLYRAPRRDGRYDIKNDHHWFWFCLEHVRVYNAHWNYYQGMSEDEIVHHWKRDITWDRTSWPLGSWQSCQAYRVSMNRPGASFAGKEPFFSKDPFGLFGEDMIHNSRQKAPDVLYSVEENKALLLFKLPPIFTPSDLQKAYRVLVKKYHPDVNGGSKKAEDMIKTINNAYHILKSMGQNKR